MIKWHIESKRTNRVRPHDTEHEYERERDGSEDSENIDFFRGLSNQVRSFEAAREHEFVYGERKDYT